MRDVASVEIARNKLVEYHRACSDSTRERTGCVSGPSRRRWFSGSGTAPGGDRRGNPPGCCDRREHRARREHAARAASMIGPLHDALAGTPAHWPMSCFVADTLGVSATGWSEHLRAPARLQPHAARRPRPSISHGADGSMSGSSVPDDDLGRSASPDFSRQPSQGRRVGRLLAGSLQPASELSRAPSCASRTPADFEPEPSYDDGQDTPRCSRRHGSRPWSPA